jgi:hypothetical protein
MGIPPPRLWSRAKAVGLDDRVDDPRGLHSHTPFAPTSGPLASTLMSSNARGGSLIVAAVLALVAWTGWWMLKRRPERDVNPPPRT